MALGSGVTTRSRVAIEEGDLEKAEHDVYEALSVTGEIERM